MGTPIYMTKEPISDSFLNELGKRGWYILIMEPLVLYKEKKFDTSHELVEPFLAKIEQLATQSKSYVKKLNKCGYRFKGIKDEYGSHKMALTAKSAEELSKWRVELNTSETNGDGKAFLYITFGNPQINFPAFVSANAIEKYFKEEIGDISDFIERVDSSDD